VLAMRPGLAKIIEKVHISWYFESSEADLHLAENACCINYANTWSPKQVHWMSKSQCPHCTTSDYGCEDMLELYIGVAWTHLPLTGIHTWVSAKPKILRIPAAINNSGWMDECQVCHGSIQAISILDLLDVEEAYCHIASRHRSVQWHVPSHGWRDASFGQDEDSMEGSLVLHCKVSLTEACQILPQIYSNDGHDSDFHKHPRFIPEVAIVYKVGPGNGY
jgi:hypothetical protein